MTIRLPDMSVNQMPTVELNCKNDNQTLRQDSFIVSDLATDDCSTQIAITSSQPRWKEELSWRFSVFPTRTWPRWGRWRRSRQWLGPSPSTSCPHPSCLTGSSAPRLGGEPPWMEQTKNWTSRKTRHPKIQKPELINCKVFELKQWLAPNLSKNGCFCLVFWTLLYVHEK